MALRYTKPSLLRDFRMLALIVLLVAVGLSLWFMFAAYKNEEEKITQILAGQAGRLDRALTDTFDYTEHMMVYMAKQISANGEGENIAYIYELLKSFRTEPNVENLFSWSTFMWYNKNYHITVEGTKGVLDKPKDLSTRDYIPFTVAYPGKLFLGMPLLGAVSNQWIIPGGVGATNNQGKFIGGIAMGFNLQNLSKKLEKSLNAPGVSFQLFDKDLIQIGQSPGKKFNEIDQALLQKLMNIENSPQLEGLFTKPKLLHHDVEFIFYQRLIKYPYILLLRYDKELSERELWRMLESRIIEFFVIALLSIAILFFLYKRIIVPVIALSETATKIADGQYHLRATPNATGEIGQLIDAFNIMIDRVEDSKAFLEQKIHERTLKLQEALHAKDEFLNNMSHEIRTPISCIQSMAEVLYEDWDIAPEAKKQQAAKSIYDNCKRLFSLLNNLLDLARTKAGKMTYAMEPQNLTNITHQIITELHSLYTSKGLELSFEPEPNLEAATLFDPIRIEQVIRNLLTNSIKFTPHGTIKVTLKNTFFKDIDGRNIEGIQFSVQDEGVGIPSEELHSIFDVFTQSTKTKNGAGGTGLGLSISKEIITAHHGIIWAENNAHKKGATVSFILPRVVSG